MKKTIELLSHAEIEGGAMMSNKAAVILGADAKAPPSLSFGMAQTGFVCVALLCVSGFTQAADECGPGPVVECGTTPYVNGITYNSAADLSVTKTNTGVTTLTNNGANLTGTGNASVNWNSTIGGITGAAGTAGPVIDAVTGAGTINILTNAVTGTAASVTHGIRAQSVGTGDINISTTGAVSASNATTGNTAIAAQTAGGDIEIVTGGAVTGRLYGIQATTAGSGNVVVTSGANVGSSATAGVGLAAIQAIADAGNITLNVNGNITNSSVISVQGNGQNLINLRAGLGGVLGPEEAGYNNAGRSFITVGGAGSTIVNIVGGASRGTLFGGITATAGTGNVTINNEAGSGGWSFTGSAIQLGVGNDTINNAGLMLAATGPGLLLSAREFRSTTMAFGGGVDTLNNTGTLLVGGAVFTFTAATTGINDGFLGRIRIQDSAAVGSEALLQGLEAFNNSGLIVLGGHVYRGGAGPFTAVNAPPGLIPRFYTSDATGEIYCRSILSGVGLSNPPPDGFPCTASPVIQDTDLLISSVLSAPGTLFTGAGASMILLDAVFGNGVAQTNCQDRTGGAEAYFRLPGADCIDLREGATAGSTQIIVRDARSSDQGVYNPDGIVIVDVNGGQSEAEHFTLSPESDHYRQTASGRGVIDKGLFVFPLIYDETTQQHKLVGIPGASALQLPLLTHAAQSLARQVTASGLDERSQTVRSALRSGAAVGGGFWGEFGQSTIERDLVQPMTAAGDTLSFNNDYDQDSSTMILGGDWLISNGDKTAWLVGGSIGYVRSEVGFSESGNNADLEGVALGLHGGYLTGHWFLNAGYSQSFLQVDDYVPTFSLSTDGSGADTKAQTQSVRVDGGRRFSLTDALHLEPLVSLAWIRADFDDLLVASPDNALAASNRAKFGNAVSLRGALGARIGFDHAISALRLRYALTGRYWNEFDGQTDVRISSADPEAQLSDTFDGSFLDLAGRISLSDAEGHISGYVDATSVSGDGYSSLGFSAGFRYQW